MRFLRWLAALTLTTSLGACAAPGEDQASSEAAVTDVPESSVRDQGETGNCWLFATMGWIESLEMGASGSSVQLSPAYLDYWDWYEKITSGRIEGQSLQELKDALDSGGSWGAAVELVAKYGVVPSTSVDPNSADADKALAALAKVAKALQGELATADARADRAKVRAVLDAAFAFPAPLAGAMQSAFPVSDAPRAIGSSVAPIRAPSDIQVRIPKIDSDAEIRTLDEAIGTRAEGDNPDLRVGEYAFSTATFEDAIANDPTARRGYYKRIQRALASGTAVPIGWYWADNGDDVETGKFPGVPKKTSGADDSTSHESIIDDYQIKNVPGFGTLVAGKNASDERLAAALDDSASIVFFRIKNSFGERTKAKAGVKGYDDLYLAYLEGMLETCPKAGQKSGSKGCTKNRGLEDVVLPAGF